MRSGQVVRLRSGRVLRAVLFDAGNTLVFLDYERMAEGVGAALGLKLTGEGLSAHAAEASSAMEQAAGGATMFTCKLAARLTPYIGEIRGRFEPIWMYFSSR